MDKNMRVAVFGTGAVGGYFGGRLAQAGVDVTFIARGEHLQAIRENGLQVASIQGDFTIQPAQTASDPERVGGVDLVILGVKAWQVRDAALAMQPMLGADTIVLPLQNGVDAARQLADVLGGEHVIGGLCRIMSVIEAPGTIRHLGAAAHIAFGEMDRRPGQRMERLRGLFSAAQGVDCEVVEDIQAALWNKFLLIAPWSGVGAVTRAPIGIIRDLPETRRMLEGAMQEIFALAVAQDISLPPDAVAKMMAFVAKLPADGLASMQRDIMEGRPSELNAQTGAVHRLGLELGVATPINSFIYGSLLPMEQRARGE
ncbi:MAG: 2-dehydropantoate 2-reductase [Desulfobacterales bacterium]|nr:2-dehydropantoate 2-reductase [Desulfobacterales bacterium]